MKNMEVHRRVGTLEHWWHRHEFLPQGSVWRCRLCGQLRHSKADA